MMPPDPLASPPGANTTGRSRPAAPPTGPVGPPMTGSPVDAGSQRGASAPVNPPSSTPPRMPTSATQNGRTYRSFPPTQMPTPQNPPTRISNPPGRGATIRSNPTYSGGRTAQPAQTGPARVATAPLQALGVTAGIAAIALVVFVLIFNLFISPSQSLDNDFSDFVVASHTLSFLPFQASMYDSFAPLMFLLVNIVPLGIVSGYWFGLRRFFRANHGQIWLSAMGIAFATLVGGLIVSGMILANTYVPFALPNFRPDLFWTLATLTYYPVLWLMILAMAAGSGLVGISFARIFTRWPSERMRQLETGVMTDLLLVVITSIVLFAVQMLLYTRSLPAVTQAVPAYWWIPAGALIIAIYACIDAFRPATTP